VQPKWPFQTEPPWVGLSTVTSDTSLGTNDSELSAPLNANTNYAVEGALFVRSSNATPDFQFGFDVPTGATMDIGYMAMGSAITNSEHLETDEGASEPVLLDANDTAVIFIKGTVENGSTAGALNLLWSQVNSNANGVSILEGSYLRAEGLSVAH
jgi:hypothetical protein